MIGVTALSGRIVSAGRMQSRLQSREMAAPVSMVVGRRTLWFSVPNSIRAICGVASPRKDTGPQKAVAIAVSNPVDNNNNVRTRVTLKPRFSAY